MDMCFFPTHQELQSILFATEQASPHLIHFVCAVGRWLWPERREEASARSRWVAFGGGLRLQLKKVPLKGSSSFGEDFSAKVGVNGSQLFVSPHVDSYNKPCIARQLRVELHLGGANQPSTK